MRTQPKSTTKGYTIALLSGYAEEDFTTPPRTLSQWHPRSRTPMYFDAREVSGCFVFDSSRCVVLVDAMLWMVQGAAVDVWSAVRAVAQERKSLAWTGVDDGHTTPTDTGS